MKCIDFQNLKILKNIQKSILQNHNHKIKKTVNS